MKIVAITSCPTGIAHTLMAAEALKKAAAVMGHEIKVETQGSVGTKDTLTAADIAAAEVVLLATDIRVDTARFAGKPIHEARVSDAIRHTQNVINAAVALVTPPAAATSQAKTTAAVAASAAEAAKATAAAPVSAPAAESGKRLVGITSCPTGIAHTFMAAEALQKAAKALGHTIKVETQGSVGAKNQLTAEDIAAADAVVIAA